MEFCVLWDPNAAGSSKQNHVRWCLKSPTNDSILTWRDFGDIQDKNCGFLGGLCCPNKKSLGYGYPLISFRHLISLLAKVAYGLWKQGVFYLSSAQMFSGKKLLCSWQWPISLSSGVRESLHTLGLIHHQHMDYLGQGFTDRQGIPTLLLSVILGSHCSPLCLILHIQKHDRISPHALIL